MSFRDDYVSPLNSPITNIQEIASQDVLHRPVASRGSSSIKRNELRGQRVEGVVKLSKRERLQETWIWELLAVCWAIICLGAIAIILLYISDKAVSSWPLPIEPNALIGIFSTLAKAALMTAVPACVSQLKWIHFAEVSKSLNDLQTFDEASRGPLGSLLLIFALISRKGKSSASRLVSLGCIITVMALAVEPFTQQIISYRQRMVVAEKEGERGETATLAVANAYDRGGDWKIPMVTKYLPFSCLGNYLN